MNYTKLFAAIKDAMKKKRINVNQLAFLSGCSDATLISWLENKHEPTQTSSLISIFKIIDMLKIDVDLFAEKGETVGSRIKYLRIKKLLSGEELAKRTGCCMQQINQYEANQNKPLKKLKALALALNTTPEWILHGDVEVKKPVQNGLRDLPADDPLRKVHEILDAMAEKQKTQDAQDKNAQIEIEIEVVETNEPKPESFESCNTNQTSTAVSVFNFENHHVRTVIDESGAIWFVAKDVADVLGYNQTSDALSHCKHSGVLPDLNKINNLHSATKWIPESDMYRLIMKSTKSEAEKFQDWVSEQVLPTIRKTGSYTAPNVVEPVEKMTITQINNEFKAARELAFNRGFLNGEVNDAATRLLRLQTGIDLDAMIGKPKMGMDVTKLSQRDLLA